MNWNEVPTLAPLRPGDPHVLAGYTVAGRLGEGGQGTVFLAHGAGGHRVALKLLHARFSADPKARARFVREVDAARRVGGFCTARVLAADLEGDVPYVVSEFIAGPSLRDFVLRHGPQVGSALERLAIGTLTALVAVHRVGIVHRDFKPGNVLLSPEGPRVVDFGIARILDATSTLTSQAVGTPAFMAPEQLDGRPVTPATDLFAWGATMAYAGTGSSPFDADSVAAVVAAIFEAEPDLGALAGPIRPVIESCLVKDPAARPRAADLLAWLLGRSPAAGGPADGIRLAAARVLAEMGSAPHPARSSLPPEGTRHRPSRRGVLIGAGVVTLMAAALGGAVLLRGGDDERTRWRYNIHGDEVNHIVATDDALFFVLGSGALYALDAATGHPRWRRNGDLNGLALSDAGLFTDGAGLVENTDPATGRIRWSARAKTAGKLTIGAAVIPSDPDFGSEAIAVGGDVVIIAVPEINFNLADLDRVSITAFGTANGERRWIRTISRPVNEKSDPPLVLGTVTASPRVVVLVVGATVYGLSTATGTVLWQFHLGGTHPCRGAVAGDTVLIGGGNVGQVFHALDAATGRPRWQAPILEFNEHSLATDAQTVYVADANDYGVHALDIRTGHERWRRTDVRADETWGPAGGVLYAFTVGDPTARALDASTGKTLWERSGRVTPTIAANGSTAFLVMSDDNDKNQTIYAWPAK